MKCCTHCGAAAKRPHHPECDRPNQRAAYPRRAKVSRFDFRGVKVRRRCLGPGPEHSFLSEGVYNRICTRCQDKQPRGAAPSEERGLLLSAKGLHLTE